MAVKRRMKRKAKYTFLSIVSLFVLTILVLYVKDQNSLRLKGSRTVTLNLLEEYIEDGVLYKDQDVTKEVTIDSNVDLEKVGNYQIVYTYQTSKGHKMKIVRRIIVKDLTLPTITLIGGNEIMVVKGEAFNDPGYEAKDNLDGDLHDQVKVSGSVDTSKEGDYELVYSVSDKSGNKAKKTRKVTVTTKNPLTMSVEEFSLEGMFTDTILPSKKASSDYMDKIIYTGDSIVLYYDINKLVPSKRLWYKNGIDPKTARSDTVYHLYKDTKKTLVDMYEENQPEISIITLGSNSVAYMDIDVFIENYKALLTDIVKASPKTKLIVQSIPPVDKKKDLDHSPLNNDKINKFNYHIVKMCQELGLKFLNSADAMKDKNGYAKEGYCIEKDGIHPSKLGHTAIYDYTENHAFE